MLLSGGGLAFVEAAFGIARELAPSTVVLEDVDLVATERFTRGSTGVLFELLNELEGRDEDTDLLVVLTTNRPGVIEPALAANAQEITLPESGPGRARQTHRGSDRRLYQGAHASGHPARPSASRCPPWPVP